MRSWVVANAVSHTFNLVVAESSDTRSMEDVEPTVAYDSAFTKALQAISSLEFVKKMPVDPIKYVVPVGVTVGMILSCVLVFICVLKVGPTKRRDSYST